VWSVVLLHLFSVRCTQCCSAISRGILCLFVPMAMLRGSVVLLHLCSLHCISRAAASLCALCHVRQGGCTVPLENKFTILCIVCTLHLGVFPTPPVALCRLGQVHSC